MHAKIWLYAEERAPESAGAATRRLERRRFGELQITRMSPYRPEVPASIDNTRDEYRSTNTCWFNGRAREEPVAATGAAGDLSVRGSGR